MDRWIGWDRGRQSGAHCSGHGGSAATLRCLIRAPPPKQPLGSGRLTQKLPNHCAPDPCYILVPGHVRYDWRLPQIIGAHWSSASAAMIDRAQCALIMRRGVAWRRASLRPELIMCDAFNRDPRPRHTAVLLARTRPRILALADCPSIITRGRFVGSRSPTGYRVHVRPSVLKAVPAYPSTVTRA